MPTRPAFIEPCAPKAAKAPPKGEAWLHEPKWDGYRCIVVKDGKTTRLFSRNRTEWTERLPILVASFAKFAARTAVIDAELCVADARGKPDFRDLHRIMREKRPDESRLVLYAFDLMHANGADLTRKPLIERKLRLIDLGGRAPEAIPNLIITEHFNDGELLFNWCKKSLIEGIVSKNRDRPYTSGLTGDWLKTRCPEWKERNSERWRMFEVAE